MKRNKIEEEDITPSPRILRTLGEIPFQPSQCLAELIDNALDAFASQSVSRIEKGEEVQISWSGEGVPPDDRTIDVQDNGPGMPLEVLKNCVRAGYTSKTAEGSLGLFGMGFNIATARLGEKTEILSATAESKEWVGLEIDFSKLEKGGKFRVPIIRRSKSRARECGTKISIGRVKPNIFSQLVQREPEIREFLCQIYSPLLQAKKISILLRGKRLAPIPHCIWDEKRFVLLGQDRVHAVQPIRFDHGSAPFDILRNRYLGRDEQFAKRGKNDGQIVPRKRIVWGWLGIQRFADPDDYGIDFIRNGRKILVQDKSLFYYLNPFTNKQEHEYPRELGTSVGGRIVGEIHVDHIPPTYQKNDFDRSDVSWTEMTEALRGTGPTLVRRRKELNITAPNTSPLAKLMAGYRYVDSGTRWLFAPNGKAKEMYRRFLSGEPEFQSDSKWWQAAQEENRRKADDDKDDSDIDKGEGPSEDLNKYGPEAADKSKSAKVSIQKAEQPKNDELDELRLRSREVVALSGQYGIGGVPILVRAWEVESGRINLDASDRPMRFQAAGNECEFFYNPRHETFEKYSIDPRIFLLISVAEHIKIRERNGDVANNVALMMKDIEDLRIDPGHIQELAADIFMRLRESIPSILRDKESEALKFIHDRPADVEEVASQLHADPALMNKFIRSQVGGIEALGRAPSKVLVRLVDQFPDRFLDGKFFKTLYSGISLVDQKSADKLKSEARGRVVGLLNDALWIQGDGISGLNKVRERRELERCAHSLAILQMEIS